MTIILVFACLAALAVIYAFWLRDWLKQRLALAPYFDWIEPIATRLWARSRTILSARLYWLAGLLIGLHDFAAPILLASGVEWQSLIPPEYQRLYPFLMVASGLLFEALRRVTREPLDQKE